jgi:nitroreductase
LGNEDVVELWVEDASIAAMIAQLTATSLGLASCWTQIRLNEHSPEQSAEDYVRELLGIPENYRVLCILGVGYPAEQKEDIPKEKLPFEKIHVNKF